MNLTFDTAPGGLTLYLDGIAHTAPFVYDDIIGFNHTIEARNQAIGGNTYNFASWSEFRRTDTHDRDAEYRRGLHRDLHGGLRTSSLCAGECRRRRRPTKRKSAPFIKVRNWPVTRISS